LIKTNQEQFSKIHARIELPYTYVEAAKSAHLIAQYFQTYNEKSSHWRKHECIQSGEARYFY